MLLFVLLTMLFSPVSLLGALLALPRAWLVSRWKGTSLTALGPLVGRWIYHELGRREDPQSKRILFALPAVSKTGSWLMLWPTFFACRVSGYTPPHICFPARGSHQIQENISIRTEFLDAALEEHLTKLKQLVVLGAGFDIRAYSGWKEQGVRIFEVDVKQTQAAKRAALKQAGLDDSHVTFVEVDFHKESWTEKLEAQGFNRAEPAFLLWEGVTYYLNPTAVKATLKTISTALASGSVVAFDYFCADFVEGRGAMNSLYRLFFRAIREPMLFGIERSDPPSQEVEAFLELCGMSCQKLRLVGSARPEEPLWGGVVIAQKLLSAGHTESGSL